MAKLLGFIFLLFSSVCFSQANKTLEFSIAEIDSLSKQESYRKIHDLGGRVTSEKTTTVEGKVTSVVKGTGYSGIKPYYYFFDSDYYDKLKGKQLRYYDDSNCYKLLKATSNSRIDYEDGTFDYVKAEFYYDNQELFFVKIEENVTGSGIAKNRIYLEKFISDLKDDNRSGFTFTDNLKEWVLDTNNEIIKFCVEIR